MFAPLAAALLSTLAQDPGTPPAPLFVVMVTHFDSPASVVPADLDDMRTLTANHPAMKWTHMWNPVAYTQSTPFLADIEQYLFEAQNQHGAEIGVHTHMYQSLVTAAGVAFRASPSVTSSTVPTCGSDSSGYTVPMTEYSADEMRALLEFSIDRFQQQGFPHPRSFAAGYYAANIDLQTTIASLGFRTSNTACPPGTAIGAQFPPCWDVLSGWGNSPLTHSTPPWLVSTTSIHPDGPVPYLAADDGPLMEIPANGKIDWMVSATQLRTIFDLNYAVAASGTPATVSLQLHPAIVDQHLGKFDQVLAYVDGVIAAAGPVPVIYATVSEARLGVLEHMDAYPYCIASPNSVGEGAHIAHAGVPSVGQQGGAFGLSAFGLPPGEFGLFFYGPDRANVPFGDGVLCVGGPLARFPPLAVTNLGTVDHPVDFTVPPASTGSSAILPGSTWNFQFWYRDPTGPLAGFNTTDALHVRFRP